MEDVGEAAAGPWLRALCVLPRAASRAVKPAVLAGDAWARSVTEAPQRGGVPGEQSGRPVFTVYCPEICHSTSNFHLLLLSSQCNVL